MPGASGSRTSERPAGAASALCANLGVAILEPPPERVFLPALLIIYAIELRAGIRFCVSPAKTRVFVCGEEGLYDFSDGVMVNHETLSHGRLKAVGHSAAPQLRIELVKDASGVAHLVVSPVQREHQAQEWLLVRIDNDFADAFDLIPQPPDLVLQIIHIHSVSKVHKTPIIASAFC
jgi:hypothetical protein